MENNNIITLSFWFAIITLVISVIASYVFRYGQEKKIFSSDNPELTLPQGKIFSSLSEALPKPPVEEDPVEVAAPVVTEEQQTVKFVERLIEEVGGLDKLTTTISEMDQKNKDAFKQLLDKTFKEFLDVNGNKES